jgi:uncharacterized SAM-binding protein YcdF (DUF218 family)
MSKRSDTSQIYDANELKQMLEVEGQRPPVKTEHFPDFTVCIEWLNLYNLNTDFFTNPLASLDNFSKEVLDDLKTELLERTLSSPQNFELTAKRIENYLGEEDIPEKSDIIIVFSGKSEKRIDKAVELYKNGLAAKILIAGKSPNYLEQDEPEAVRFARRAFAQGIPEESIIIENESINIVDSIKRGFNLLDTQNIQYNKIIEIISWYKQRRAWASMIKYTPYNTIIHRVNSDTSPAHEYIMQGNWYKYHRGIDIVFNEFIKMKVAVTLNSA